MKFLLNIAELTGKRLSLIPEINCYCGIIRLYFSTTHFFEVVNYCNVHVNSKVSYGARNGGRGGAFGCYCVRNGGARFFFRNVDSFWRFPPLLPKRQKLSSFRKNFRVPRCEHSNTQLPHPPRCVPSKTLYYSRYFSAEQN